MKLILVGGVQGVGKTTLLSWLRRVYRKRLTLLDPGELFRRYHYNRKIRTTEEVEELIIQRLEALPDGAVAAAHWHYAVKRPTKYIPQIAWGRLVCLAHIGMLEHVTLLVVEAPAHTIQKRRMKDRASKKRSCALSDIRKEIAADEEFLEKYHTIFRESLGTRNVITVRLQNTNLAAAKRHLGAYVNALYA